MENPSFYSIIPADVRYADITPNAKLLYGEITALCNKSGVCFATNQYFANLYKVSKKTVSLWIKELQENKFIKSNIIYKEGSNEILHRYIQIFPDPMEKNVNTPMEKNVKDNNISINNTSINKENILKEKNEKILESFELFWKEYPKQRAGNKQKSFKAYCRVIKEKRSDEDKLLEAVKNYAKSEEVSRGFAKGCEAWLNDDRFNCEYKQKTNWEFF